MSLRSPAENENGGISFHRVPSSTRHSRARGNPGLLRRISLDTRFRGYDGTQAGSSFSSPNGYFQRRHEGHEGFRRVRFAHRSVSEYLPQRRKGRALSFRTKREIFPRSLAFARDDRPWDCRLASWRSFDQAQDMLGGSNIRSQDFSTPGQFAQAAQIRNYSSAEFAEIFYFKDS